PRSAANAIRVAIEELLTALKIKRFRKSGGQRRFISLHERILSLPQKYANEQNVLLAAKWLGNAGSHSNGEVTGDDVLDLYEFVEHVLSELYVGKTKSLIAKANRVNKFKGPESRKKARMKFKF